jgi:hypothetical protein
LYRGIPDTNDASTCSIPTLPLWTNTRLKNVYFRTS